MEDSLLALELGASALGINFYERSPRYTSFAQAKAIMTAAGGLAHIVAVLVDPSKAQVEQIICDLRVNTLQFHGNESPAFCEQFNYPYFKALRVKSNHKLEDEIAPYHNARGILLDTYVENIVGGTGKAFDWSLAAQLDDPRLIVAGGLTPENITDAIQQSGARAFDVASGVESAPGVKDPAKLQQLFSALQA